MQRTALIILALLLFTSCGGGSRPQSTDVDVNTPAVGCDGFCADTPTPLSVADVEGVIARAVNEAQARNVSGTIAVVDRVGNVLAVFQMNAAATAITITSPGGNIDGGLEGVNIVPDSMAAISKAVTAAYLST